MRSVLGRSLIVGLSLCLIAGFAGFAVSEVEPNDAMPQSLGVVSTAGTTTLTVSGASGYPGDIDWYAFRVDGDGAATVRLAVESSAEWQIVLYAEDMSHIASATDTLARDLEPGAYRARIQEVELGRDSYTLVVSTAMERESNDGLLEATPLGTVQTDSLVAFASIDPAGDVDFFSFVVGAGFSAAAGPGVARVLRIDASCPTEDTLLLLYAKDETLGRLVPVARNDDAGNGRWSRIYLPSPEAGTYVVRIHEYADNAFIDAYRVSVTPMDVRNEEPNDTQAEATSLGRLDADGRLETTQFLEEGDADFFSFDVATAGCVAIETAGDSGGDSVVCLYDEAGKEIACDDDGGADMWSRLFRELAAGRYAVSVRALDEDEVFDYTLSVSAVDCPAEAVESEPNGSVTSADELALPVDVSGAITADDVDVYRFTLAAPATIWAETYGDADADTTICLLDADGESLLCDDDGGADLWSALEMELDAGTYYLGVELYSGTGDVNYHLTVRASD